LQRNLARADISGHVCARIYSRYAARDASAPPRGSISRTRGELVSRAICIFELSRCRAGVGSQVRSSHCEGGNAAADVAELDRDFARANDRSSIDRSVSRIIYQRDLSNSEQLPGEIPIRDIDRDAPRFEDYRALSLDIEATTTTARCRSAKIRRKFFEFSASALISLIRRRVTRTRRDIEMALSTLSRRGKN